MVRPLPLPAESLSGPRLTKNLFPLPAGVAGSAELSENGLCRRSLSRAPALHGVFSTWLWIGHNPSAADGRWDDATVRVEWNFQQREEPGSAYLKMNLLPFRSTSPVAMPHFLAAPSARYLLDENERRLLAALAMPGTVVVASGAPSSVAVGVHMAALLGKLRDLRQDALCVGTTAAGWPRHALRQRLQLRKWIGEIR